MSIQEALNTQGQPNGGVSERRNSLTGGHPRVPGRRTFSISGVREMVAPSANVKTTEQEIINASRARLSSAAPELVQYVCCDVPTALKFIQSDQHVGLTSAEAARRLAIYGPNELAKAPPTPFWKMVLEQFNDLLVMLLLAAALLSAALGDWEATIVIFLILIANATLGVRQEYRAGRDLDALQNLTTPKAPVIRDGKQIIISSVEIVPGDIVTFEAGQSVPADCRLVESQDLSSTEQSLTGESEPVKKDAKYVGVPPEERAAQSSTPPLSPTSLEKADSKEQTSTSSAASKKDEKKEEKKEETLTDRNCLYFGCHIQDGRGKGVVITTGMRTRMGEIKKMIDDAEEHDTPLQEKLHTLGVRLGLISIVLCTIIFLICVTTGRGEDPSCSVARWLCDLQSAVALVVAAVPEGLPACVTITLAIGMQRLSKKNCLVTKLKSVETLGSATVICTDKTGTLTRGVMTAVRLWIAGQTWKITGPGGYEPTGQFEAVDGAPSFGPEFHLPLVLGVVGSNASLQKDKQDRWEAVGNSSERPLVVSAAKVGLNAGDLRPKFRRLKENVFDSGRKMMSVLLDNSANTTNFMQGSPFIAVAKGAPNVILQNSNYILNPDGKTFRELTESDRSQVLDVIDKFSEQAFRVLAVSYKPMQSADQDSAAALESGLYFCGLFASIDPEREEVTPSIAKAAKAGIRTVMITGDYVKTARAISENIGLIAKGAPESKAVDCARVRELGEKIRALDDKLEAMEKDKDKTSDYKAQKKQIGDQLEELWKRVDAITASADVYARAKPADKLTIVKSLQRQGNVCSMTGDGVNDAPALKQADIGVAMGITGTDVAKQSALMILTDDNFVNIVEAVEQGRTIYANISKFVFYLLSTNASEVLSIFMSVIIGLKIPLTVLQILWLNLTTDGAPAIALAVEATEPNTMLEGPRLRTEPLLEKVMVTGMIIQTIVLTTCVLAVYVIGLHMEFKFIPIDGQPENIQAYTPLCNMSYGLIYPNLNYTAALLGETLPANAYENPYCNFSALCGYTWREGELYKPCFSIYPDYITDADFEAGYQIASTMVTFTIIFAELARAYSSRSMRESVFTIGVFKNTWMQYGVFTAVAATWLLYVIPGVKDVFQMRALSGEQFGVVFAFCFIPFVVDEICKFVYRATGFGKRPIVAYKLGGVTVEPAGGAAGYQQMTDKSEEKQE